MKMFHNFFVVVALIFIGAPLLKAQPSPVETPANLKDSTEHTVVVVERTITEKTNVYQVANTNYLARKIAIIVENHADAKYNDEVPVLEDLVSSRVAGKGYTVLSRDVVMRSLKNYSNQAAVDRSLESGSSALRLAQNLGADFILIPSITSVGLEKKTYNGNGISTVNTTQKLRVSYKIVEAGEGGALRGGSFVSEKNFRDTPGLNTSSSDVMNDLLDDAADQLADAIVANAKDLPAEVAKAGLVTFSVACTMTDPRQQPILMSAIGVSADNRAVTNQPVAVEAMDVTVEMDGAAIGSAPGEFKSRPGLHKLTLSREGFETWSRTVNIYNGQTLRVALQMSVENYERWQAAANFLATLDTNRKLNDAEINKINGLAEFYKNSHYRVDTKDNVQIHKSLY